MNAIVLDSTIAAKVSSQHAVSKPSSVLAPASSFDVKVSRVATLHATDAAAFQPDPTLSTSMETAQSLAGALGDRFWKILDLPSRIKLFAGSIVHALQIPL